MNSYKKMTEPRENKRFFSYQAGLAVAFGLVLIAFEWKTATKINPISDVIYTNPVVFESSSNFIIKEEKHLETKFTALKNDKIVDIFKIDNTNTTKTDLKNNEDPFKGTDDVDTGGTNIGVIKEEKEDVNDVPFSWVGNMPSFKGCEKISNEDEKAMCTQEKIMLFLQKNIQYPQRDKEAGNEGIVYVNFVVGTNGDIESVRVLRGVSSGLDAEAVRCVKSLPKFNPGMQGLKKVAVYYNLLIRFKLR